MVVLFAYPIKLNITTRNGVTKILPTSLILIDGFNLINKISGKIWF